MAGRRRGSPILSLFFLFILMSSHQAECGNKLRLAEPCKTMVLYYHDIIYNGRNADNATSAIIGAPAWGNRTKLAEPMRFGDVVVFDDPITLDNDLHSQPAGRAQGYYLYDGKEAFAALFVFSIVLNSTEHKGTINLMGADLMMNKKRDVSVVGGTGDFFLSRGVATLTTDAIEAQVYFRLRLDIKLYECY